MTILYIILAIFCWYLIGFVSLFVGNYFFENPRKDIKMSDSVFGLFIFGLLLIEIVARLLKWFHGLIKLIATGIFSVFKKVKMHLTIKKNA